VSFRCPSCRQQLELEDDAGRPRCVRCGWVAGPGDGILDFVSDAERADEREYYEGEYATTTAPDRRPDDIAALEREWRDPVLILNHLVWEQLGPLAGRRIVLLGNGASEKELFFLRQDPELLVFSDLSAAAVRSVRDRYDLEAHGDRVCFAAIDAFDLPLADESVDLVYGNAFVHHLDELDRFFAEVARVLRPGGRAVFMDDAYAPLWQHAKQTWLRPLMRYTHRLQPISPEDLRFTMGGGFREDDLAPRVRAVGGEPWFHRQSFLYYFWTRARDRLIPDRMRRLADSRRILRALIALDDRLARFAVVRENLIRLVWGFDKPAGVSAPGAPGRS
jgi:SAM-dependent methyltransferase